MDEQRSLLGSVHFWKVFLIVAPSSFRMVQESSCTIRNDQLTEARLSQIGKSWSRIPD